MGETTVRRGHRARRVGAALAVLGVAAVVAGAPIAGPAGAAPTGSPPPTVTTKGLGATISTHLACDGTEDRRPALVLLNVDRTGDTSGSISVDVAYGGTLEPGVDYDPLPDPVVIPSGEDLAVFGVEVRAPGTLSLTVLPGEGYEVGDPALTTVSVDETPTDAICPPEETQTIAVGQTPTPIPVYDRYGGHYADSILTIDGQVPPGLDYARDGSWAGAATTPGTYRFVAEYGVGDRTYLELPLRIVVLPAGEATPEAPTAILAATPAGAVSARASYTG